MEKKYCITYKEKRMFRWYYGYSVIEAHKYQSAIDKFSRYMPKAIRLGVYVEYRKR
jgi:hypothetical protein